MTLYKIQKAIAEKIKTLPLIKERAIGVAFTDAGDTVREVNNAVLQGDGIYVNVQSPRWTKESEASLSPVGSATVTIAVGEKPDLNRARGDGYLVGIELTEYLARHLNLQTIAGACLTLDGSFEAILEAGGDVATTLVSFKFKHQITGDLT